MVYIKALNKDWKNINPFMIVEWGWGEDMGLGIVAKGDFICNVSTFYIEMEANTTNC